MWTTVRPLTLLAKAQSPRPRTLSIAPPSTSIKMIVRERSNTSATSRASPALHSSGETLRLPYLTDSVLALVPQSSSSGTRRWIAGSGLPGDESPGDYQWSLRDRYRRVNPKSRSSPKQVSAGVDSGQIEKPLRRHCLFGHALPEYERGLI
jgi:hypothetical protein